LPSLSRLNLLYQTFSIENYGKKKLKNLKSFCEISSTVGCELTIFGLTFHSCDVRAGRVEFGILRITLVYDQMLNQSSKSQHWSIIFLISRDNKAIPTLLIFLIKVLRLPYKVGTPINFHPPLNLFTPSKKIPVKEAYIYHKLRE